jgi:hypothetical protein
MSGRTTEGKGLMSLAEHGPQFLTRPGRSLIRLRNTDSFTQPVAKGRLRSPLGLLPHEVFTCCDVLEERTASDFAGAGLVLVDAKLIRRKLLCDLR